MELNFESISNDMDVFRYTKHISNSNELCIICQLDELEDGKQWDRYKLVCGHTFHTRCFRKWVGKKQCTNCPYCGDILKIEKNEHCHWCKTFGLSAYNNKPCINDKEAMFEEAVRLNPKMKRSE